MEKNFEFENSIKLVGSLKKKKKKNQGLPGGPGEEQ